MVPFADFIERRKEHRLPHAEKVIFTEGKFSMTAYAANISRGGLFVTTLDPIPLDTVGYLAFVLPNQPKSLCVKAKVVHIVFDRQRVEVECGMGLQFLDLNESQKSLLNLHILNQQSTFLELKKILSEPRPNSSDLNRLIAKAPQLKNQDLLSLRYRVNRICTLFETEGDTLSGAEKLSA